MTNNLWSFWPYWVFWPSIAVCLEIWWGLHSRIYCNVQCHQKLSAQSIPGFHRVIIMTTLLQQAGFLTWGMPRLRFFTWSLPAAGIGAICGWGLVSILILLLFIDFELLTVTVHCMPGTICPQLYHHCPRFIWSITAHPVHSVNVVWHHRGFEL